MKRFQFLWVAAFLSFVVPAAAAAKADEYPGITWKKVAHEGTKIAIGQANVTLDTPIEQVVEVVTDYKNYHRFMPNFKKSKVLAERGTKAMIYLEVGIMKDSVTLWGQMRMSEKAKEGTKRIIVGKLIEGNMDAFNARWELTPVAGGKKTKVQFQIFVDPDMPLPSSLFTKENVKAARRTLKALRERIALTSGA